MTPFDVRTEFRSLTDRNLLEWELVLVDEVNHGPRQTVRLTQMELDILRSVMEERGVR